MNRKFGISLAVIVVLLLLAVWLDPTHVLWGRLTGEPFFNDVLISHMEDEEDTIREHAAEAIGDIGPTAFKGIPYLVKALDDPATRVRRDSVRSLGYFGEAARGAVPKIKVLLKDPEEIVRDAAKNALKSIAPDELPEEKDEPVPPPGNGN